MKYGVPKVSTKGSSLGDQHEINEGKTHLNGMICNRAQQLRINARAGREQQKINEPEGER